VKHGICSALTAADCRGSARCKLEGNCTPKDGKCIAGSSGDCAQSSVCAQVNLCIAREGVCVGAGGGARAGARSSGPPDKVGSTTITSPLGH
jgi:hypothetical protein